MGGDSPSASAWPWRAALPPLRCWSSVTADQWAPTCSSPSRSVSCSARSRRSSGRLGQMS